LDHPHVPAAGAPGHAAESYPPTAQYTRAVHLPHEKKKLLGAGGGDHVGAAAARVDLSKI
jgi:hypothetical protein